MSLKIIEFSVEYNFAVKLNDVTSLHDRSSVLCWSCVWYGVMLLCARFLGQS
jgi:hypothetical protein